MVRLAWPSSSGPWLQLKKRRIPLLLKMSRVVSFICTQTDERQAEHYAGARAEAQKGGPQNGVIWRANDPNEELASCARPFWLGSGSFYERAMRARTRLPCCADRSPARNTRGRFDTGK